MRGTGATNMATKHIDAEVRTALGCVRAVRASWSEPIDSMGEPDQHWLELSMLPRSQIARGCFPERWGPHRFERVGAMFFLPAHHAVHVVSECYAQSSVVCIFRPDAVRAWLGDGLEWTDGRLQAGLDLASPVVRRLMLDLGRELREPGFASGTLVESLTAQIAVELGRHFRGVSDVRRTGGLAPWRLRLIDDRLGALPESPSLADLAALCGLSVRQLARGFRTSRGCSIGAYLAGYQVEQAKRMLAGEDSIKAVAHRAGFGSPSSFSVAFRRATGETPRAFRMRIGRGDIVAGGARQRL
jgi:AraC family transcriptional regulator